MSRVRRKRSDVWAHFKEVQVPSKNSEGVILRKVVKLECNSCKQRFAKSKDGTTLSLKRHIEVHCAGPNLQRVHKSSMETGESMDVDRIINKRKRRSDVWVHFEEVEVPSVPRKVVKLKCKCCGRCFAKSKGGTTSTLKRHLETHLHLQTADFGNEGTLPLGTEVSENDTSRDNKGTKSRSDDVWGQFEEAVVTEKKQHGSILEVKKLRCNKCKKLFTKSEDGGTSALKRHMEESCTIRNGQRSLLDYCIQSSK